MSASIACNLDAAGLADRKRDWAALRGARVGEHRTVDTLTTTWRLDPGVQAELERLVAAERQCCALLRPRSRFARAP